MKKSKFGYIGLGKMGMNMALRLREKKWPVVAFNRSEPPRKEAEKAGIEVAGSLSELVGKIPPPRLVWLMVPNAAVDEMIAALLPLLAKGDTVIDGGNSYFRDSMRRAAEFEKRGIHFLDVGVSGGPGGARRGACLMVGGEKERFEAHEALFRDMAAPRAFARMGPAGAGHFVKMVHNGIEYGMMQAIAEGFSVLRGSEFKIDLEKAADLYNQQSVIESRLVGWLESAYGKYGPDLGDASPAVAHTGEGEWTIKTAKELGLAVPVIEASFKFRIASESAPSYQGKVLSALRNQFGGHEMRKKI